MYKKKYSVYNGQYCLSFQASVGNLWMHAPADKGGTTAVSLMQTSLSFLLPAGQIVDVKTGAQATALDQRGHSHPLRMVKQREKKHKCVTMWTLGPASSQASFMW